jgi:hypothetical protein
MFIALAPGQNMEKIFSCDKLTMTNVPAKCWTSLLPSTGKEVDKFKRKVLFCLDFIYIYIYSNNYLFTFVNVILSINVSQEAGRDKIFGHQNPFCIAVSNTGLSGSKRVPVIQRYV